MSRRRSSDRYRPLPAELREPLASESGHCRTEHRLRAETPRLPGIAGITGRFLWRYRWDLNPRCAFTHTTFRELHLRPLGHGTEDDLRRRRCRRQNERMPRGDAPGHPLTHVACTAAPPACPQRARSLLEAHASRFGFVTVSPSPARILPAERQRASAPALAAGARLAASTLLGTLGVRPFRGRVLENKATLNDTLPVHSKWWRDHAAADGELLYVAVGDSAAQGIGASRPDRSYVGVLADDLRAATGRSVRVVNLS